MWPFGRQKSNSATEAPHLQPGHVHLSPHNVYSQSPPAQSPHLSYRPPSSTSSAESSSSALSYLPSAPRLPHPDVVIHPNSEIIGSYVVESFLGKGSFAEVKLGRDIYTNEKVALKFVKKENINTGKRKVHLQREIKFLKLLCHPHIGLLYEVIETDNQYVLIMEHVDGGELLHYIRNADKHRLKDKEARRLFRQIVSAVDYCHHNSLIHRDIKPENILLDSNKDVKMVDFGFSNMFCEGQLLDSFIGSPHYAAPELLKGQDYSGPEVDIWSLGVLLYAMVAGKLPFRDPDIQKVYQKIIFGQFDFPDYVSSGAQDLISRILVQEPKLRLTMEGIRHHPWLCKTYPGPPPTYMEPRAAIVNIDPDAFAQLLKYGFHEETARSTLFQNGNNPICNFYHLILEKRKREQDAARGGSLITAESPSPKPHRLSNVFNRLALGDKHKHNHVGSPGAVISTAPMHSHAQQVPDVEMAAPPAVPQRRQVPTVNATMKVIVVDEQVDTTFDKVEHKVAEVRRESKAYDKDYFTKRFGGDVPVPGREGSSAQSERSYMDEDH